MPDKIVKKHRTRLVRKLNGLIDSCKEAEAALTEASNLGNIVEVNLLHGWGMRVRMECEGLLQRLE